jgi:formamidase
MTLQVDVVKGRTLEGPVLFPLLEDLPPLVRPLTQQERQKALTLARDWGVDIPEETAPISVIGTGSRLNAATDNGLARAATLLGMSLGEVPNRATINGGIEIGRHPGVIQVTFLAPLSNLEGAGLLPFVKEHRLSSVQQYVCPYTRCRGFFFWAIKTPRFARQQ